MSGVADEPTPYRVSYSGRAKQRLLDLAVTARKRGDGEAFLAALSEFV